LFGILAVLLATFLGIVVFSRSNWLLNLKTAKAARTRAREVPQTSQPSCQVRAPLRNLTMPIEVGVSIIRAGIVNELTHARACVLFSQPQKT
jgi:hypothetical protein